MFGIPPLRSLLASARRSAPRGPTLKAKRVEPRPPAQQRASEVGRLIFFATGGQVQRTEVKYETLAAEGYEANPVVYRCFRLIADAIKSMPVLIKNGEEDVTGEHELSMVLASPNPDQIWEELIETLVGHLGLAGEFFLEGVTLGSGTGGKLAELYALRPDKMEVQPGADGLVAGYVYNSGSGEKKYQNPPKADRFRQVLHLKYWNPRNTWRGLPPLLPAAAAADEHNQAAKHAKALYDNAARPSGALVFDPKEGPASLTDPQFQRLRDELTDQHQGADNAGRPMVLDGGLKWVAMGLSPKDMEAGEGRNAAAREIALSLGVPPLMLGINGDNTFANYKEARLAFWQETVWPLARLISKKLTVWVRPLYGPEITITLDQEGSPIAEAEKSDRWERVKDADFLTFDEKRSELGFEPLEGDQGTHILVNATLATLEDVIAGVLDTGQGDYGVTPKQPAAGA